MVEKNNNNCATKSINKKDVERKRNPFFYFFMFALPGIILSICVVIYDSGAHAAWAAANGNFKSYGEVKKFLSKWPVSTLGKDAYKVAVKLFGEHAKDVEQLLSKSYKLKSNGDYEELRTMINLIESCDTPSQVQRLNDLKEFLAREENDWNSMYPDFEKEMEKNDYESAFYSYKKLRNRFPIRSRTIEFPACVRTFPSQASIRSGELYLGVTPRWIKCLAGMDLCVYAAGFFPEKLVSPCMWDGAYNFVRLKPEPEWLVMGGGRAVVKHGCVFLFGYDDVLRCVRLNTGSLISENLEKKFNIDQGQIAFFDKYFVLGGKGVVRVFSQHSLREIRTVRVGEKKEMIYVGDLNNSHIVAGGVQSGTVILGGGDCNIDERFPGAGPASGFIHWAGGHIYATEADEVLYIRNHELLFLGQVKKPILFAAKDVAGGVEEDGMVQLWNEKGKTVNSFRLQLNVKAKAVCARGTLLAVGTSTGVIQLISLEDGRVKWGKQLKGQAISSIEMTEKKIVVGTENDGVYLIDLESGDPLSHIKTEGPAQLVFHDGILLISDNRALYCYRFE